MVSFNEFPTTASASGTLTALFSAYASVAASLMLVRSMANEIVPPEIRHHISVAVRRLFTPLSSEMTVVVDEYAGMSRNEIFEAAELYLRSKIPPSTCRLRAEKLPRQRSIAVAAEKGEKIPDEFEGIRVTWKLVCLERKKNSPQREERQFVVSFDKKFKNRVLDSYLPHVLVRARAMRLEDRVIKLHSRDGPFDHDYDGSRGGVWGSVNLEHPATFETVAMDPELKRSVMEDLDRFLRRQDFYKKVGKAWKRGYLLYGPPGTGKSSLIAAMANYLKFDVYDVELNSIYSNAELRRTLLSTTNRSILVIEDIDCSVDLNNRNNHDPNPDGLLEPPPNSTKFTLSGLLNFIDGLWSSCGDERIIVFTTNNKDRLDPALLRPGRMDVHINMSYCTVDGFRTLASNYLSLQHGNDLPLCQEIEGLIGKIEVTPAEVAEELMRSEDVNVALKGLVNLLKRKRVEKEQPNETVENADVIEPKKPKSNEAVQNLGELEPKRSKRIRMNPSLSERRRRNTGPRIVKKCSYSF